MLHFLGILFHFVCQLLYKFDYIKLAYKIVKFLTRSNRSNAEILIATVNKLQMPVGSQLTFTFGQDSDQIELIIPK
jgi:hypothetical protein